MTCVAGSNNSVTTIYNYDAAGNRTLQAVSVRPIAGVVYATVYENSNNNPITANITGGPATGVSISSGPTLGSASVGSNFTFLYTPQANSVAPDSFQYTASNANGSSDPATVFITIMQAPPTVVAVSQTVGLNCSGSIITPNVIGGGPASSVAISSGPGKGTVSVSGTLFVYTPNTSATNFTDTFQYTATNAAGTSAAAATVTLTLTLTVTSSVSCWGSFNWGTGVW